MNEKKNDQIFRQKTLDRIASPEQLTDYLHVTNPGIWVFLAVIILLLAGFFGWASVGQLETVADAKVSVSEGTAQIMLSNASSAVPSVGMKVRIGNEEFIVSSVEEDETGHTVAYAPVTLANGTYDAKMVLESISPISFLLTS